MRESDSNNLQLSPCGGTSRKPVHFETNPGSKNVIGWTVLERADNGNCTMKIGADPESASMFTLFPIDGSADDNGSFPCGREESNFEGKMVRFPKNLDCNPCTFVFEWATEQGT